MGTACQRATLDCTHKLRRTGTASTVSPAHQLSPEPRGEKAYLWKQINEELDHDESGFPR